MIETLFCAAMGCLFIGPPICWWWSERKAEQRKAREKAELIAMGAMYDLDYVPGESTWSFKLKVLEARDRAAKKGRLGL